MKALLVTPPLTQLNTPYPATCHLLGFLHSRNHNAEQMDLGIELIGRLFTGTMLKRIFEVASQHSRLSKANRIILQQADFYIRTIDPVMRFLGGKDATLAQRFCELTFWPESKRLPSDEDLEWGFGLIGNYDRATHLCALFLKDLCDFINSTIDPHFELIRYAESLCLRLPEFRPLQNELQKPHTLIDTLMLDIFSQRMALCKPDLV